MMVPIMSKVAESAVCWCEGRKKRSSLVIEELNPHLSGISVAESEPGEHLFRNMQRPTNPGTCRGGGIPPLARAKRACGSWRQPESVTFQIRPDWANAPQARTNASGATQRGM